MVGSSQQFHAIEQACKTIHTAFPYAYANAKSDSERTSVMAVLDMAGNARSATLNKAFHAADPTVQELTRDLQEENEAMAADLEALKDVARFLCLASAAARTATMLATFPA